MSARCRPPFVLLDDNLSPGGRRYLFDNPVSVIRCDEPRAVPGALRELNAAAENGLYAAGFLAYELGYLLEPRLADLLPGGRTQPLIWMGLFDRAQAVDREEVADFLGEEAPADCAVRDLSRSMGEADYRRAFDRVKDYITAGDVYQINLTFKHRFAFDGDPIALYGDLRRRQRVAHGALIGAEDFHVLSLSPELFLQVSDGVAEMRPMKGTAARGRTPSEDADIAAALRQDEKSRAENLMILDLMRNDLGRIAEVGSVAVTDLFTVETYRTLHQMTSGVTARLRPGIAVPEILRSVFPCGSVTGAPKIRAMEIIRELETAPRGVYTGAVGMIAPGGDMRFNVAIRTLWMDADGQGELGIGSGVVYDSDGPAEYAESVLKGAFLTHSAPPFALIETLRWNRGEGYYLLDRHLDRLAASAEYFAYPYDRASVTAALETSAADFDAPVCRVRMTLDEDGGVDIAATAIEPPAPDTVWRYVLAAERTNPGNPFLFHKTTNRAHYDDVLARMKAATGCDEVLFCNDRGELTEGSYTNLFVERGGRLLTPPIDCGLLNGTLRQALIDDPAVSVEECALHPDDLRTADAVFLGNSVRDLVRAVPVA